MSMLSGQCDKLREMADNLERTIGSAWIRTNLAPMLRDAADTIWELRNRCADIREENDRLKDGSNMLFLRTKELEYERNCLRNENAKLRELLQESLMDPMEYARKYDLPEHDWNAVNAHLDARMRELGIEVDG